MKQEHKKIFESLVDYQIFGLCIEREAGGEPFEGRVAVGTVILNRVDKKGWMGQTIQEVILKPWQFSWTMPEAGESYYDESVKIASNWVDEFRKRVSLQECCEIATRMITKGLPRDPDLAAVHCVQYLNPKVAGATKEKWLAAGMKVVKEIGHHQFFA